MTCLPAMDGLSGWHGTLGGGEALGGQRVVLADRRLIAGGDAATARFGDWLLPAFDGLALSVGQLGDRSCVPKARR